MMESESKQFFTLMEVNSQLTSLRRMFDQIMQIRGQLKVLYERLDDQDAAPSEEEIAGEEVSDDSEFHPQIRRDRRVFLALVETLRELVEDVQESGCIVKDIESGIVDWPGYYDGREVILCWQYGEQEVGHWRETQSSVTETRPVSELIL